MIKFFRRVRQRLLTENKFSKYLLYAIGEIALVMIGILLALQVNNWNNVQKEKSQEQKILQDLKVEFKTNQKDALRIFNSHSTTVESMKTLQSISPIGNNDIDTSMVWLSVISSYTPAPGASNNLINSGNLSLISNEKLRNQLTVWSGVVEELYDDEDEAKTYTLNTIIPFLAEHYPIINNEIAEIKILKKDSSWINSQTIPLDDWYAKQNLRKEFNTEALLKNQTFQNHISTKKIFAIHCASEASFVVEAAQTIVNLIDSELKRLRDD